jgi:hypothetical protein
MDADRPPRPSLVPVLAAGLALMLLAAPFWPVLFPVVVGSAGVAASSLALARRRSRPLLRAIAGIAVWLTVGLAGAWIVRGRPLFGLAWVLAVLYLLPLPVIPWLYWWTFEERDE